MTISIIVLATTDVFGRGGDPAASGLLTPKQWLSKVPNALKRLDGKAVCYCGKSCWNCF